MCPEEEKTKACGKNLKDTISVLLMNINEKVGIGF